MNSKTSLKDAILSSGNTTDLKSLFQTLRQKTDLISDFDECLFYILPLEIKDVENPCHIDPNDPGGETAWGVSKRAYPHLDITNLTLTKAMEIYEKDYWNASYCSRMPDYFRLVYFDCCINQGVNFAIKALQRVLKVTADGIIGKQTLGALEKYKGNLKQEFALKRVERYFKHPKIDIYGKGFMNRLTFIICQGRR